ncbi:MAG TPA: hypothetical protein GXX29_10465 [Firmicutes bacterium]|nr:hypothetical protein [Bacillota bacterium]
MAMSADERLVLENRLAWLSGQLSAATNDPDKVKQLEEEYFAISRALRGNR